MKTSLTKTLCFTFVLIAALLSTTSLKAQLLEEIPNPPNVSLNFFSGGENGSLYFEYVDFNFNTSLYHYDGLDLTVLPIPTNNLFSFYNHSKLCPPIVASTKKVIH